MLKQTNKQTKTGAYNVFFFSLKHGLLVNQKSNKKLYARYWMLGASALGRPRGMVWGGRREEGSGWGTHVYLWQIHFDIWQE